MVLPVVSMFPHPTFPSIWHKEYHADLKELTFAPPRIAASAILDCGKRYCFVKQSQSLMDLCARYGASSLTIGVRPACVRLKRERRREPRRPPAPADASQAALPYSRAPGWRATRAHYRDTSGLSPRCRRRRFSSAAIPTRLVS
jgi:hypothetical protein